MVDCSKYVCDVHFLLIWLLLIKDYTTNNLIKVWHWIDQIIFVYSLSKFLPRYLVSRAVGEAARPAVDYFAKTTV